MRKLTILFIAVLLTALSIDANSQSTTHKYIDKIKNHQKTYAFTFPGGLVRTGLNEAFDSDVKDSQGYKDIVRGIKQLRFVVADDSSVINKNQFKSMVSKIKENDGLEDYVRLKEDGNNIVVLVKEKADRIYNLVVITHGDDEFAMITVKTDISLSSLEKASFSFNEYRNKK